MKFLMIIALLVVALAFFVRRAAVTPSKIHETYEADTQLVGGYVSVRRFDGDASAILERLRAIALATPRTEQLDQAQLTFVTRSPMARFPDVTQVFIEGQTLTIHAHLVYGKSDFGVNKARVLDWLDRLGPLTQDGGSANP